MKKVKSSTVDSIGYDPDTQTLTVKFKNGQTYEYDGVSRVVHALLEGAESVGSHLHKHIIGIYKHRKKEDERKKK